MPAFSNHGTVALSAEQISRKEWCMWSLVESNVFDLKPSQPREITDCPLAVFISLSFCLSLLMYCFPPLFRFDFAIQTLSHMASLGKLYKSDEPQVANGCRVSLQWWLCLSLLSLSLSFYNLICLFLPHPHPPLFILCERWISTTSTFHADCVFAWVCVLFFYVIQMLI